MGVRGLPRLTFLPAQTRLQKPHTTTPGDDNTGVYVRYAANPCAGAIIESVDVRIAAVYPGVSTMVDAVVAGVQVRAEWVGAEPGAGDVVDAELDIDDILRWGDTIAVDDTEMPLREIPLLRGTIELQERAC